MLVPGSEYFTTRLVRTLEFVLFKRFVIHSMCRPENAALTRVTGGIPSLDQALSFVPHDDKPLFPTVPTDH